MAAAVVRVVGKPITDGTRTQRAEAAMSQDGKQALQIVNQSKKGKAKATTVSTTFGRVYNATGDTVTFVTAYDWEGRVAGRYPVNIQNGQWAVFEHVGTRAGPQRQGSVAALVYGIEGCCEAMISWNNRWKTSHGGNRNTAYCEMNDPGYFKNCDWDEIHENLMSSGTESEADMEGYATKVSIDEGGNTPSYSATFYLDV